MSSHSAKSIESDVKSMKSLLKQIAKDVQHISYRQLENESKINELARAKEEKSQSSKKSNSHPSLSQIQESLGEGALESMITTNHPLGEIEEERKRAQGKSG